MNTVVKVITPGNCCYTGYSGVDTLLYYIALDDTISDLQVSYQLETVNRQWLKCLIRLI